MFRGPLLMQQGASLTRALSLFRQMGLHHILIAPPDPRAIGFITRKVTLHGSLDSHRHFSALSHEQGTSKRQACGAPHSYECFL